MKRVHQERRLVDVRNSALEVKTANVNF